MRPEITYSKVLPTLAAMFLFQTKNHYDAFVALYNLVLSTHLVHFLMKDDNETSFRLNYFKTLIKEHCPKVAKHLDSLGIPYELPFYRWFEFFFHRFFPESAFLRMFDIFLVRGEIVLFEMSLAIFKTLEMEILRVLN